MSISKKWINKYLKVIDCIKSWSKDRSTKVGAIIIDDDKQILSTGYNGFPRGVNDELEARHERPIKYKFTEHAERNAIYNYCRRFLKGTTMLLEWFPCTDCTRAIIQCGIKK